jgi:hypothetical protein
LDKKYFQQEIHLDLKHNSKVLIRDDVIKNPENHIWYLKKEKNYPNLKSPILQLHLFLKLTRAMYS